MRSNHPKYQIPWNVSCSAFFQPFIKFSCFLRQDKIGPQIIDSNALNFGMGVKNFELNCNCNSTTKRQLALGYQLIIISTTEKFILISTLQFHQFKICLSILWQSCRKNNQRNVEVIPVTRSNWTAISQDSGNDLHKEKNKLKGHNSTKLQKYQKWTVIIQSVGFFLFVSNKSTTPTVPANATTKCQPGFSIT